MIRYLSNFILLLYFLSGTFAVGNVSDGSPKINLEIIQTSLENIADNVVTRSSFTPQDTVVLRGSQSNDGWIATQAFSSSLKKRSIHVFYRDDSSHTEYTVISLGNFDVTVLYDSLHREGLFGEIKGKRHIYTRLTVESRRGKTGEVTFSDALTDVYHDTIAEEDIHKVESSSLPFTHGELPKESFLDRFVEPLVVVGATGLVVFLFFNVRTQ